MNHNLTATKPAWRMLLLLCLFTTAIHSQTVLFPFGTTWKYSDKGTNLGTSWRAVSYSDASWKSGPGQLGYGDGDEATKVSYGSSSSKKYVTTYFRKAISITGKSKYTSFKLEYKRDDGIVIYVNGTEVKRDLLPSGTISYTTLATAAASDDGATIQTATLATTFFAEGNNVIAVEIHQNVRTSSDLSFDMRLTGIGTTTPPPTVLDTVTRGPYLQMVSQNAITIRWATNNNRDSKLRWGTVAGNLVSSLSDVTQTKEHELRITALTPDTKYFYSIGTSTAVLEETAKNFFTTAPLPTTTRKIRIAAYGDCGNNSTNQVNVRNAYLSYMGSNTTDLWVLLGDNAYEKGLATEYQSKFFDLYKNDLLKNIPLFPATGNHDYANDPARQDDHNIPYLSLFTMPKNGESGGVPSGREEYYSFDYGDIHFISLDSYGEEQNKRFYDTTSSQILWLKNDLAMNSRKWTIAYFHHPPYTMGGHNSDTDAELVGVRTKLIRILERFGVDLVLTGHSHSYERSYLLHDHFGLENTFSFTTNAFSSSTGKYDGTANSCPYISTSEKTKHGTVYVLSGSAGQIGGTQSSFPHAAMSYSNATTGGSLAIEIQGNRLDAKFVAADNTIKDQFTIFKDVNKKVSLSANPGDPVTLSASWNGSYSWTTGATTQSVTVTQPAGNYEYVVTDNATVSNKCLSDTFSVTVGSSLLSARASGLPVVAAVPETDFSFKVFPNPVNGRTLHVMITSRTKQNVQYVIQDMNGRLLQNRNIAIPSGASQVDIHLPAGVYVIKLNNSTGLRKTEKIVVQ